MTQATSIEPRLSDSDRQALELAVEVGRELRPDLVEHYFGTKSWVEAAIDIAHICQTAKLNLRPWECCPPASVAVDDADERGLEHRGISKSAALLRRMLSVGVSRWHPDPLKAIAAAEAERAA